MPSSRGSSQPRDQTRVSCVAGGFFTIWATWEDPRWRICILKCENHYSHIQCEWVGKGKNVPIPEIMSMFWREGEQWRYLQAKKWYRSGWQCWKCLSHTQKFHNTQVAIIYVEKIMSTKKQEGKTTNVIDGRTWELFCDLKEEIWGNVGGASGKEPTYKAGNIREGSLIPGLRRSPGEGTGSPLRYSRLENSMDRGAWQATVHGLQLDWCCSSNWSNLAQHSMEEIV